MGKVDPMGANIAATIEMQDRAARAAMVREARMGGRSYGAFTALFAAVDGVGLGHVLDEARALRQRADAIGEQMRQQRAATERRWRELVKALAAGTVSLADVTADLVAYRAMQPDGPVSGAAGHAQSSLHDQATDAVSRAAPKLMGELAAAARVCVDESVKLDKTLPGDVGDERGAFAAGVGHFATWGRLGELVDRFVALHDVAGELRSLGWTPRLSPGSGMGDPTPSNWLRYERPDKLDNQEYRQTPPQRRLAYAHRRGARPGLYDAPTADRAFRERERAKNRWMRERIEGALARGVG